MIHPHLRATILNVLVELGGRTRGHFYCRCLAVSAAEQCLELSSRHSPLLGDKAFAGQIPKQLPNNHVFYLSQSFDFIPLYQNVSL
jgi:hypothetical protein